MAKIKSNRDPKKEETFTDYFNFKEPFFPKKTKEVKFIRKSNLLQKKAQKLKYNSKVFQKKKQNFVKSKKKPKIRTKVEFKLSLRNIISEKLKLKRKILL